MVETPPKILEPKLSIDDHQNISDSYPTVPNYDFVERLSGPSQSEWKKGDEQKETFPDIEDDNSVAASELTMDTFFRNQETNSHSSKDRSWSAFLGFGSNPQSHQQHYLSSAHHQSHSGSNSDNLARSSSFFGFSAYGSFYQSNNSQRHHLDTNIGSSSSDMIDERGIEIPFDGSISQQSSGVKPTRLQQQQASLMMRTQRSIRSSNGNKSPLVDPLAQPGRFGAMRSPPQNSPAISRTPPQPPSSSLMIIDAGDSDALCDLYPNQEDQMFEEMKFGVHSSSNRSNSINRKNSLPGQNPATKQIHNRNMPHIRAHSTMSSTVGSSHPSSPANSEFYISSSTDDEFGSARSTNNSLSPKPHPTPYYRSQSTPIQSMQSNGGFKDSPSVGQGSSYPDHYVGGSNREIDMQNPMNLKKAFAAKAAQMARSGTAAGAAASAAALANANSDRSGSAKASSSDERDIEYAIMLSLQEEQQRRQLEEAERKAIEEAVQRSTINTRPSIRLLQSTYYNSR